MQHNGTFGAPLIARTLVAAAVGALLCAGCDLKGIPKPGVRDAGLSDTRAPDIVRVCQPSEQLCDDDPFVRRICNDSGTAFVEVACPPSTTCESGDCVPIQTECQADDGDSQGPHFSISKSRLVFETNDDLKATSATLEITNCGDTSFYLSQTQIDDPNDAVGNQVFRLENAGALLGLEVPPGDSQSIKVQYQPQFAFSRDIGHLVLALSGPFYKGFRIPLIPKTYCVTATPELDLGHIDEDVERGAYVQNCGSEPVELTDIRVDADPSSGAASVGLSLELPAELPVLEPGEFFEVPVKLDATAPGEFARRVVFDVANSDKFPRTPIETLVHGRVLADECVEAALGQPTVWTDDTPAQLGWTARTYLDENVRIALAPPAGAAGQPVVDLQPPRASHAQLQRPAEADAPAGQWHFQPDVAGTYRVEMNYLDADGMPLCDSQVLDIEVVPDADFYVDLQWISHGDYIPRDIGYGRGADLNLHVIGVENILTQPNWQSLDDDCFGFGEYPLSEVEADAPESTLAACAESGGQIRSTSVSGARREIITIDEPAYDFYRIAVHAWNIYDFQRATAQLTMYADGEPVDQIFISPFLWQDEQPPANLQDLLVREVGYDNVWVFGVWDVQSNWLMPTPPRLFAGFP